MICILGYSVNASAIMLDSGSGVKPHEMAHSRGYGQATFEVALVQVRAPADSALRAAVVFWLVIKLTRGTFYPPTLVVRAERDDVVVVLFVYAWKLPKFRRSHVAMGIAVLIPMLVYLVSLVHRQ